MFFGSSRILVGRYGRLQIAFPTVERDSSAVVFKLSEAFSGRLDVLVQRNVWIGVSGLAY